MYFYENTFEDTVEGPQNLFGPQGHGFRINGDVSYLDLDNNRIADNGDIGLQLGGDNVDQLRIVNNTISNNDGPAVTVDFGTVGPFPGMDLVWSNNTVANNGNNFQLISLGFLTNSAPTVGIDEPFAVPVGEPVTFSLSFADDGTLAHALWDLGEGLPVLSTSPSHVYSAPGTYRVGLVVWDNDGRAAYAERLVTVVPEPSSLSLAALGLAVLASLGVITMLASIRRRRLAKSP
jgi:hypothetical protein